MNVDQVVELVEYHLVLGAADELDALDALAKVISRSVELARRELARIVEAVGADELPELDELGVRYVFGRGAA